jgi:hypothetical protein
MEQTVIFKNQQANSLGKILSFSVLAFFFFSILPFSVFSQIRQPGWPSITRESKPWSRWWWMGSAVDQANLKVAMESYAKAGLGGLEITPIYGVHGYESRNIPFLSPEWVKNLEYTLQEGKQLDMGIDMAMASGWPFGGPWVTPDDACKFMSVQSFGPLKEGGALKEKVIMKQDPLLETISRKNLSVSQLKYPINANADSLQCWAVEQLRYPVSMPLQTLMAYSDKGKILNLTDKVDAEGKLDWTAPAGVWRLFAIFEGWHGKMVERAGPGGEGDVIDHFSDKAIDHYLTHFDESFKGYDLSGLRAYFNDSYEVDDAQGESNYTPLLFDEFKKRRGYDLREYIPGLLGLDNDSYNQRVLSDYRETVSDLILEKYTKQWHNWAVSGKKIIRNQAHGAPANILDLYAVADIPETEGQDIVKMKMASSAANITGKKLTSSESATWLKDHFEASLSDVKQAVDLFFLAGINHVFYHGTTFSPQDAPWPGWMFYAAVNFGPTNTLWNDFPTLNAYIARTQSFLQRGKPDNDILLYYPIADEYAVRGNSLLKHFDGAAKGTPVRSAAEFLLKKGYAFDFISDRQVAQLDTKLELDKRIKDCKIVIGDHRYQTILFPKSKFIPVETFEKIIELAKKGATILMEQLPEDVPGLYQLKERQQRLAELKASLKFRIKSGTLAQKADIGMGQIIIGGLSEILSQGKVHQELVVEKGMQCIRRVDGANVIYFIANREKNIVNGWVTLDTPVGSAVLYNPMNGNYGKAKSKTLGTFGGVYLQLLPGESCIVEVYPEKTTIDVKEYPLWTSAGTPVMLNGEWDLSFVSGGPELPQPVKISQLGSWTELSGQGYKAFSGTAVYKTTFGKPSGNAATYRLDLGKVAHSARIRLNGKEIAALISSPYTVEVPALELQSQNTLEVLVTNLMGNRIADMERKGEKYKIFYNVNFPAKDTRNRGEDGLFTTLKWKPQESGLFGPVTLTPLQHVKF